MISNNGPQDIDSLGWVDIGHSLNFQKAELWIGVKIHIPISDVRRTIRDHHDEDQQIFWLGAHAIPGPHIPTIVPFFAHF